MKKKTYAIIALIILAICLVSSIADFSLISGGLYEEGNTISDYTNNIGFAPYIYNEPRVDISLGYTPPKSTIVLYCTYTITDSNHETVDSSIMLHFPFFSEYIISKTLTNLANDNYTFIINAYYANGIIHTPLNETFTVDTTFIEPKLIIISPQNLTYNTNKVDIIYHVNSKVIWSYYAIDSISFSPTGNWIPFKGNITLDGLSEGSHEVAISVKTEANEHSDQPIETHIIYFIINTYEVG